MDIGKVTRSEPTRVGELLVKSGFISNTQLNDALVLSKKTATPVGRILLMTGSLREKDLLTVLRAQAMIRSGKVKYELAIKVINQARQSAITFEEALERQGIVEAHDHRGLNELAELLLLAQVVSEFQLKSASDRAEQSGLPLGRTLVLMGLVSPSVMATALNAQVLMRQNQITLNQAIHGLTIACARRVSLEEALKLEGIYESGCDAWLKLGELFAMAGMLSESDSLWVVEASLVDGRPFGELLLDAGLVSEKQLGAALELQRMVAEKQITPQQAAELMRGVNAYNIPVQEAFKQLRHFGSQVVSLIKMAGFLSESQIEEAKADATSPIVDLSLYLFEIGLIDKHMLSIGRDCLRLIREDKIKINQAVVLLNYCTRSNLSIPEALQELAWDQPIQEAALDSRVKFSAFN
jgi:hypothetical protein